MNNKFLPPLLFFAFLNLPSYSTTIYVNTNVQGGNQDGTSWADALASLQTALVMSNYGDTICVAQGTYKPTTGTSRFISFTLKNGIKLYGGFNGTEASLDERDWQTNTTILSGDIGVPGDSTDNSYNVLYCNAADSTTVLDGFTVTGGNADLATAPTNQRPKNGGGMYLVGSSQAGDTRPVIANCTFTGNHALAYGGALFIRTVLGVGATPFLQNCVFKNNTADSGAGVYKEGGSTMHEMLVEGCVFETNSANSGGGFCFKNDSGSKTIMLENCQFFGNFAPVYGGGIYLEVSNPDSKMEIRGCLFWQNHTGNVGEGSSIANFNIVYSNGLLIDGCRFIENYSEGSGSISFIDGEIHVNKSVFISNQAMHPQGNSTTSGCFTVFNGSLYTQNSIFFNSFSNMGSVAYIEDTYDHGIKAVFNNCVFSSNKGSNWTIEVFGINADLDLHNCIFWNNSQSSTDKLFNVTASQLTISHCLADVPGCDAIAYGPVTCGPGMIYNQDPLFADTAIGDLHLHPCSPARNAGSNAIVDSLGIATDLDGNPRIQEGTVDMGAYETPAYAATLGSTTAATCHGQPNGGVAINVQSGCGPFTVDLGGASTVSNSSPIVLQSLPAGTYTLAIIDAQGRADTVQATIGQPDALVAQALTSDVSCADGTPGSASAQANGGTPFSGSGYAYLWSGGSNGDTLGNLLPGSYSLTVTDSLGCTAMDTFSIGTAGDLEVDGTSTAVTCYGDADGTASAAPTNGTAPFAWLWQGGPTDSTLAALPPGTYAATVTDALGCTGTASVLVAGPDSIILQIEVPNLVCFGTEGAQTVATASGGTPPYAFEWATGETDSVLAGIGAGTYALSLTDANGCTETQEIDIQETTAVQIQDTVLNASSPMASDGAVLVSEVMGGTTPYYFLWSDGSMGQSLLNVPPGTYSLTVTDSLGCEFAFTFLVDFETATNGAVHRSFSAAIVPNPSGRGKGAVLHLNSDQDQVIEIAVFDVLGQPLSQGQFAGSGKFALPDVLAAGMYWVLIKNKTGGHLCLRMVVL
ncbi:MAG: T9SS type A sorting domain-containing protein [Lewinellaceae bacterium]|nr:T9SS type A sorting domain-containing protein [Lewinellaceae bacterium]